MFRTFKMLSHVLVFACAISFSGMAAPAANAQSVKGSGTLAGVYGSPNTDFHVSVNVHSDGTVTGSLRFKQPGRFWETDTAVTLVVVGNVATVTTTRGYTYTFTDNGTGTDLFGGTPIIKGDIKVTP